MCYALVGKLIEGPSNSWMSNTSTLARDAVEAAESTTRPLPEDTGHKPRQLGEP